MQQLNLFEDPGYLSRQLITYIGNKRGLLNFIGQGVAAVQRKLGKEKLKIFDVFSGSGVVARYLKQYSEKLLVNDMEKYSGVINRCYLANFSQLPYGELLDIYGDLTGKLENLPLRDGFISELYAPVDDTNIKPGERVFFTTRNARYIDTARQYIEDIDEEHHHFFIAPLLSEVSVHANTSGVFKGFYKDKATGIGWFGGKKEDALKRIKGDIKLEFPLFSRYECDVEVFTGDAGEVVKNTGEVDLAYLDPPYNQHPYGSNYFMLNLVSEYKRPSVVSNVSGIPENWNRSSYNNRISSIEVFSALIKELKAKFLLVSFNSEGFIPLDTMMSILMDVGKVTVFEKKYNTFRGSRNLRERPIHVKEYLYLVAKR